MSNDAELQMIKESSKEFDKNMRKLNLMPTFDFYSYKDKTNKLLRVYRFIIEQTNPWSTALPVERIYEAFSRACEKDEVDSLCHELVRRMLLLPDFEDGKIIAYKVN